MVIRQANVFDELRQDLSYGLRTLRRNPGFAAIVMLTLALGIGANTAIFTLINAALLRPLPVPHAEQLVAVGDPTRIGSWSNGNPDRTDLYSYPLYRDIRDSNPLVSGLFASGRTGRLDVSIDHVAAGDEAEHPRGRLVSGNYFSVLGVPAALGRTFTAEDDGTPGGAPIVVISNDYWKNRFASDRSAVGRTITINSAAYTIVGVTPPGYNGEIVGAATDLWIPMSMQPTIMPGKNALEDRTASWLLLMGRVKPGVTLEQAGAGFTTLVRRALSQPVYASGPARLAPGLAQKIAVFVSSGAKGFSRVRTDYHTPLLTLMAGVGLLLLIVCANVANLLLARAVARDREMGVRLALGAGRRRLLRQLLTESTMLGAGGAVFGLLLAWGGSRLLLVLASGPRALPLDLTFDLPVLAFTGGLAMIAVACFGLAPAVRATRVDLATTMRASTRAVGGNAGSHGNRLPFGKMLIASQVALSLLLLVSAGMLVRSLRSLENADPGLDRHRLLIVTLDPDSRRYSGDQLTALSRTLLARTGEIPGVVATTISENGIFSGTESGTNIAVEGFTARSAADSDIAYDQAGPAYFHAIGAHLLAGRDFNEHDDATGPQVAIVNETMARFFFGRMDAALGKEISVGKTRLPIVGVVADAKDHDLVSAPVRRMYTPYFHPISVIDAMTLEVRTKDEPAKLVQAVRKAIATVDPTPSLRILNVNPLSTLMAASLAEERLVSRLAIGFGALALILSAVGLYGVMSYTIARRTGEIGLRVALGASRGNVVRLVFGEAFALVAIGTVVGVPLALGAARILRSQLHGVATADPISIGIAFAVLTTSAMLAAGIPAIRAARVPPLVALRQE